MDELDFEVVRIRELLERGEAAVADLVLSGAPEEEIRKARQCRDRYVQCLNLMAGPTAPNGKRRKHYGFVR